VFCRTNSCPLLVFAALCVASSNQSKHGLRSSELAAGQLNLEITSLDQEPNRPDLPVITHLTGNKPFLRDDILAYFRERRKDESSTP
jgi:hypothetical protein